MKKLIVIQILILGILVCYAQCDSTSFFRSWNIRVSFAMQETCIPQKGVEYNGVRQNISQFEPHVALDFDYRINDFAIGAYLGYTRYLWYARYLYDNVSIGDHGLNYGMNVRYYLPILRSFGWVDFYVMGKIGGVRLFLDPVANFRENKYGEMQPLTKDFSYTLNDKFEVGAGLGVNFYFNKYWGMFGEFAIGQFYTSHYNWRVGFSVRI